MTKMHVVGEVGHNDERVPKETSGHETHDDEQRETEIRKDETDGTRVLSYVSIQSITPLWFYSMFWLREDASNPPEKSQSQKGRSGV